MRNPKQGGFTLMELMITLALVAVLMGIAVPNMRTFMQNNRLSASVNDLLRSLQLARTEAIKRQLGNVVVCATADPDAADSALTCSNGVLQGWFVFNDVNGDGTHQSAEAVIEKHALLDTTVRVRNDGTGRVSYGPTGFATTVNTSNVVVCDQRTNTTLGTDASARRAIVITQTGRARVTKLQTQVTTVLNNTTQGPTCP